MAEYLFLHLAEQAGRASEFEVASAAVSTEEIGNDIYPPAKRKLTEKGVPFRHRAAWQIRREDYAYYDYIICMDRSNLRLLQYIIGDDTEGKVSLLMSWAGESANVADPWYTGDFEATFRDLLTGCTAILRQIHA